MLTVKTPEEASQIIAGRFKPLTPPPETVATRGALGRVLHGDVAAAEYVPDFDRSTVDGYAVIASDVFGCSVSIPALLTLSGEVAMGAAAAGKLTSGTCFAVSTGGDLPEGADAVVMLEDTENYGDGLIGITSPCAPGNNVIFRGDDVSPGDRVLNAGTILAPHDIGVLSALGLTRVSVRPRPVAGIISTGDEVIPPAEQPGRGQIRDVNTPLLMAALQKAGAAAISYGIIRDDEQALREAYNRASAECDVVLISGGSSAGLRDLTARVIESEGEILFHGIAMKPGKPTILGVTGDEKPVFGLPGHPVAAYFVTELFVRPLIARLMSAELKLFTIPAFLSEAVSANHGRAEFLAVFLEPGGDGLIASPVRGKSGLIASLARTDGYICVPRDREGFAKGVEVAVTLW